MGSKVKKGKQYSCNKEVRGPKEWSDLPQKVVNLIARNSSLMQHISFGGPTKTWRDAPKKCNGIGKSPFLQLSDSNDGERHGTQDHPLHVFKISFHGGCYQWPGRYPWHQDHFASFVGCSHGLLFARGGEYAWEPAYTTMWYMIPTWDSSIPFKFALLSEDPRGLKGSKKPCVMLVLTGICFPALVFRRMEGSTRSWIRLDSSIIDPNSSDKQLMQFTNAIGVKGKIYALSLQGTLAVIEDDSTQLRITGLGRKRAVPSVTSRHFKEYFTESDGEILLIFLISKKFIDIVDEVEVFQLEIPRLSWVKMESLGNRTLFVGTNCCMSVTASKVGFRSNSIYFTCSTANWWLYDMKSNSIVKDWTDSAYDNSSLPDEILVT